MINSQLPQFLCLIQATILFSVLIDFVKVNNFVHVPQIKSGRPSIYSSLGLIYSAHHLKF